MTLDSDSNEYVISVSEHLPDEVLKKGKEIVLTLTATDTYENEAHAVLNIQLPQTETDAPTFSQIVYVLNYTDGSLEIGEDITISNRDDQSLITVTQDCKYSLHAASRLASYHFIIFSVPRVF